MKQLTRSQYNKLRDILQQALEARIAEVEAALAVIGDAKIDGDVIAMINSMHDAVSDAEGWARDLDRAWERRDWTAQDWALHALTCENRD